MMQLASGIESEKPKHLLYTPTISEVNNYCKMIGKEKVMVFVDNCLNDYKALLQLMAKPNIQIIGFERDNRYESIAYRLFENNLKFELYDVSEIYEQDIIRIIDSIPKGIYSGKIVDVQDRTIFEIIRKHTKVPVMEDKFATVLRELYSYDEKATELF